jgi:hypothetical protein
MASLAAIPGLTGWGCNRRVCHEDGVLGGGNMRLNHEGEMMRGKSVGWRALSLGAVAAVAVVAVAGYGYAAITATDQVYTGCLQSGTLSNVAIGSAPSKSCAKNAVQISWNQTGPQGERGLQGERGPQGPSGPQGEAGSLSDAPCTRTDGAAGNMTTRVTRDDLLVVSCETASGNQTVPFNDEVAAEAVDRFIGSGTHEVAITPNCSGGFQAGCSGGQAVTPPPTIGFAADNVHAVEVAASPQYNVSGAVSVRTVQPIPVTLSGVQCSLNIDSDLSPVSVKMVWNRYVNEEATPSYIVFQDAFVGLDNDDYSLSGSLVCSAINLPLAAVQGLIQSTLIDQGPLCGAPGPELFMRCEG